MAPYKSDVWKMSEYIYGIHDIEGAHAVNGMGYVLATEELGHDPTNQSGKDYRESAKGATVIARLNNGYGSAGTIPQTELYPSFAQRVSNFVANSQGCDIWQIGNEPNHPQERPNGEWISAQNYAWCYTMCREAIHTLPGHENDIVCIGAIAPWFVETTVPNSDWITYFQDVLAWCESYEGLDGITIHTYTHGANPDLVFDDTKMNAPYDNYHYHFRAYQDFMQVIPQRLAHLPVYLTETNQNDSWYNGNSGWVKNAYQEINEWNKAGNQVIRCVCLYRYPNYDKWGIEGKQGVLEDFQDAQQKSYTWSDENMADFTDSFENGFYEYQGISELTCPKEWTPIWVQGSEAGVNHRPEYKPKNKEFQPEVYHGQWAASIHTRNATHDGALVRAFDVSPGDNIEVSVYGMIKGTDNGHGVTIGIDPNGGTDIESESIIWGDWWSQYMNDWTEGAWAQVSCTAQATGNEITVFLRSKCDFAGDGMHAHLDLFEMTTDGSVEPPKPEPGENILDEMILTIDAMEIQIGRLRGMVEYLQSNTVSCIPVDIL